MKIAKNKPKSEFEVQAEAISLLKEALGEDYIVRGEYSYRNCRFDIAVFRSDSRDLVCTVEIKRRGGMRKNHKQINRYFRATNKPCILLTEHTMHFAIDALKTRLSDRGAK
jgi:RecB family endonuclease NucS